MNKGIFFSFILDHILLWLLLKGLQTDFLKVSMLDSLCEQDFAASLPRLLTSGSLSCRSWIQLMEHGAS